MSTDTTMQPTKTLSAVIAGAVYGGLCGALIGSTLPGENAALIGALLAAIYSGAAEAITDRLRQPAQTKPFVHRLIAGVLLSAALAVLLGGIMSRPLVALVMGILLGLMGLGFRKFIVGGVIGLAGGLAAAIIPALNVALLGGSIGLIYRLLLAALFGEDEILEITGEKVPPSDARYVVPFEAHTKRIGTEFLAALAEEISGTYERNRPDIGIVESMDDLRGPRFDPALVDPLIREFYEHTTRFKLSIVPEWNPYIRPFFWLFKTFISQEISQANLPINTEEAQLGMVSYVDTIDIPGNRPDHIETLRGWIRAFETTGEAIYVGIYTVVRHDDIGYVSVGFPLPEANWTVTLLPHNNGSNFLLKTENTLTRFPGHYLSDINNDDGSLTILKLPTMGEEIDVYLRGGQLFTDHHFYFGGLKFLTLYYTIERKP